MAAPTTPANVKKPLANPEPSTHGPTRKSHLSPGMSASCGEADVATGERPGHQVAGICDTTGAKALRRTGTRPLAVHLLWPTAVLRAPL
jgi:hypothetical protein